jgi:hypothetical protein
MSQTLSSQHTFSATGFTVEHTGKWVEFCDGAYLNVDPIEEGKPFIITITIDQNTHGLTVDKAKNVGVRKNHQDKDGRRVLVTRMMVRRSEKQGYLFVPFPDNTVNLVVIEEDGETSIWEVALVSQSPHCYLTVQKKYNFRCYRDELGNLECPEFVEKWSSLVARLDKLTEGMVAGFRPISSHISSGGQIDTSFLGDNYALVVWYNIVRQFGAVKLGNGRMAMVHWSSITNMNSGLIYLAAGEIVAVGQLKPLDERNGGFRFEAKEVEVL